MKDKEIQGMQIRICNACKQYKKCDKELCTMSGIVAKELSKFYQPKITENSVVLSKEEYQDLKEYKNIAEQRKFNLDYANVELRRLTVELNSAEESNAKANEFLEKYRKELEITKQQLAQASKETAEKILNEIDCIPTNEVNELNHLRLLKMNIAREFGVEIKE